MVVQASMLATYKIIIYREFKIKLNDQICCDKTRDSVITIRVQSVHSLKTCDITELRIKACLHECIAIGIIINNLYVKRGDKIFERDSNISVVPGSKNFNKIIPRGQNILIY